MALTKCFDCGHNVSTAATACPNCGAPVKSSAPPPLPPPLAGVPPPPVRRQRKMLRTVCIVAGCLLLLVILLSLVRSHSGPPPPSKLQAEITAALQEELSQNKQKLYEKVHLAGAFGLGTAKNDVIQDLSLQWKDGRATDNPSDLGSFTVNHVLYWSTPVTSDGHTKFRDNYDCSSGSPRLIDSKVIDTNGDTTEGVTNSLVDYATKEATKALHDALNGTPAPSPAP